MDRDFTLDRNLYPPIPLDLQAYNDGNAADKGLEGFKGQAHSNAHRLFDQNHLTQTATPTEDFEETLLAASATARTGTDQLPVHHAHIRNTDGESESIKDVAQKLYTENDGYTASIDPSQLECSTEYLQSQDWTSSIIDEVRDLLQILSPSGKVTFTSPSVFNLLGYEQKQLFGHIITDFIHPDDKSFFISELNDSSASQNPFHALFEDKSCRKE